YVAAGDINGDGLQDLVTAAGPGAVATVAVARKDATVLAEVVPFPGANGGATVAAGNVDASDREEVIVGSGPGISSTVKAYRLVNDQLEEVFSFSPYGAGFRGGVFVGAAKGYIVTGAGAGGGPHVKVFKITGGVPELFSEWMAYGAFSGGVRVDIGTAQVPGKLNVVTGAGAGGGPHVRLFNLDGLPVYEFFAFSASFQGGVFVSIAGQARTLVGAGPGGGPHVKAIQYDAEEFAYSEVASFFAYDPKFTGGVRVGGLEPSELPCATPLPGCLDGSNATSTTAGPTTTVKPTTTTTLAPGQTTTTVAACDTIELPGLGCLTPSEEPPPTTTTTRPLTTTTSSTTSPSTTSTSTTSTTLPAG
ncbi:MAG: VCBS repeat-containing protein, partial [Acidimicrobiales bacterium]|nr:VCBS repeat-containing protein [Acidimicrobiales bacterium]